MPCDARSTARLFVLGTVCVAGCGGPGPITEVPRSREEAIEEFKRRTTITVAGDGATVVEVDLRFPDVNEIAIATIYEHFPTIERMEFPPTANDQWLAQVRRVDQLRSVRLPPGITDTGLVHLDGLRRLEHLDASGTAVTDWGVRSLHNVESLRVLDLSGTAITDESLEVFDRLDNLRQLNVTGTGITPAAVDEFRREHPDCDIVFDR